jgi:hypothetical protein
MHVRPNANSKAPMNIGHIIITFDATEDALGLDGSIGPMFWKDALPSSST